MKARIPRNPWYAIGEVAALAGVSVDTVRGWDRDGVLQARRTPGGQRRYVRLEVEEFLRQKMGLSINFPAASGSEVALGASGHQRSRVTQVSPPPDAADDAAMDEEILRAQRVAEAWRRSAAEEARQAAHRDAAERLQRELEQRLRELKTYGRTLAAGLPTEWQARVVADLERFVTPHQFPASLTNQEARVFVEARVERARARYWDSVRRQGEEDRRQRQAADLVSSGMTWARIQTIGWEGEDAGGARRAVKRELEAQVRWDWTDGEVRALVRDVLDDWSAAGEDGDGDDDENEMDLGQEEP